MRVQTVFEQVEFKQANLANPASAEKAFLCDGGDTFDIVFNLAAETKYSQSEEVGGRRVAGRGLVEGGGSVLAEISGRGGRGGAGRQWEIEVGGAGEAGDQLNNSLKWYWPCCCVILPCVVEYLFLKKGR